MQVVLDENVSLQIEIPLKALGYEVISIARFDQRGMTDDQVFKLAVEKQAVLITRDWDFTNFLRFDALKIKGLIYLMRGNLKGSEEAALVENFFRNHTEDFFQKKTIFLSPTQVRIR